jgi:voltage-gated potassium channel
MLDLPMLCLSFVWLCILITEIVSTTNEILSGIGTTIWILFILYFSIRFVTADDRLAFLRRNWLFVLAIVAAVLRFVPFFRALPLVRALTATFAMQVVWIFTSADQGMRALRRTLGRRGTGYAVAFTCVVVFAGAAGMYHFEQATGDPQSIQTYPRALWWTAMQMTNIGSAYVLKTTGGRALALGISVYAAAMFGYLTGLFASMFIDRAARDPASEIPSQKSIQEIKEELIQLRRLIERTAFRPL